MSVQHKTLRDEILYVLGRASAPLNSGEIYERCQLADEMKQVGNAIFQLKDLGKITPAEGDGRKRYTLAPGVSAPAPEGKAGRPPEATAAPAEPAAAAAPVTGIHPAPESGPPVLDIPGLGDQPGNTTVDKGLVLVDKTKTAAALAAANSERLADAIIARLKRHLGESIPGINTDLDITTAPAAITINVKRVEINLSLELGK